MVQKQKQSNDSESLKQKIGGGEAKKPSLNVGDLCTLKITALGPNNIGIDEYSYACIVLVPSAKLGDTVQAKIVKICHKSPKKNTIKFAIAKMGALITKTKIGETLSDLKAGTEVGLMISSFSGAIAVTELKDYKIFTINSNPSPSWTLASFQNESLVTTAITRVKEKYAFAKLIDNVADLNQPFLNNSCQSNSEGWKTSTNNILGEPTTFKNLALFNKASSDSSSSFSSAEESKSHGQAVGTAGNISLDTLVKEGNKLTLVLPNKIKQYDCLPNYIVMKLSNTMFFIKLALGATLGNRVKIKLTKVLLMGISTGNTNFNTPPSGSEEVEKSEQKLPTDSPGILKNSNKVIKIAIAKVIALNPISFTKKRIMVKSAVCQMLNSGMHFGEKAVKCDARMKKYVWLRQKGENKNKPLIKKGRNIINLLKTRRCLNKSLLQLGKYAAKGRTFLFVGTKKPAAALIAKASLFSKTSFFVNTRWLGGMLTNWKTILKSIAKVRPILKEKQIIMKEVLTKRQNLKNRLISKAILLKKKK